MGSTPCIAIFPDYQFFLIVVKKKGLVMYVEVSGAEILQLFMFLQENTSGTKDTKKNPALYMIDNLIWFMAQMSVSAWASFLALLSFDKQKTKERSYIKIHEDHWIVKLIKMDRSHSIKTIAQKQALLQSLGL